MNESNSNLREKFNDHLSTVQFFGTSAEELSDEIFNLCVRCFVDMIPSTCAFLQDYFGDIGMTNDNFKSGIRTFVKLFYSSLETNSEILVQYLNHAVFKIPSAVLLQDATMRTKYENMVSEQHIAIKVLDDKIKELWADLKLAEERKALLHQRLANVNSLEIKLNQQLGQITELGKNCDQKIVKKLLSEVPEIKKQLLQIHKQP